MEVALTGSGSREFGKISVNEHSVQLLARPWGYCFVASADLQVNEGVLTLGIEGKLVFHFHGSGHSYYFGQAITDPRPLVSRGGGFKIYIDVDERTLHAYEAARLQSGGRDVDAELALRPLLFQQSEVITHPQPCRFRLSFPVSKWSELLKSAGYSTVALHRLPPPTVPPDPSERGRQVIERFQRAERMLIEGRSNEAAQQCRVVLDLLVQVYASGKAFEQNTIDKMLGAMGAEGEKRQRLKTLFAKLKDITNDPMHPELDVEYDSGEARLLLSMTALALEFFAERLPVPA